MADVDEPGGAGEPADADEDHGVDGSASGAAPQAGTAGRRRGALAAAGLPALELVALAAFTFSRPVLDSFGRSPETFVARGVTGWWIVAFGLVVLLVPAAVAAAVGGATRLLAGRFADRAHAVLVGVLGGLGAWRLGQDQTGWPGDATKLLLLGSAVGLALAALRLRVPASGTFLRIGGALSVIYLVLFLVASPVSDLVLPASSDAAEAAEAADDIGAEAPDVVVVVFDELPLTSLLDGDGRIDAELFPNFAALAGESTWYRNATSVSGFTQLAVPAMLTGRYPESDDALTPVTVRPNLFTLLGDAYDVRAAEKVTRLCPPDICPETADVQFGGLLHDAVDHWTNRGDRRAEEAMAHLAELGQSFDPLGLHLGPRSPGDRPRFVFDHLMLPHLPWTVTGDGTLYQASQPPVGLSLRGWGEWGAEVGLQRHLLQLQEADRVLGRYVDALREAGVYDDALLVVTSDHGADFEAGELMRGVSEGNYADVMWVPLFVKEPGQQRPVVDDSDVRSVDLVPTIADVLGIEVPWHVDGVPIREAAARDDDTKPYAPTTFDRIESDDGRLAAVDARAGFARVLGADAVPWSGPDALWKRTEHGDLVGRAVGDLPAGEAERAEVEVANLDRFDEIDTGGAVPIEIVATTDLPPGTFVAVAVNGRVGAVTEVAAVTMASGGSSADRVHALVPPHLLVDGANEVEVFRVDGPVGGEVLHPVAVVAAGT